MDLMIRIQNNNKKSLDDFMNLSFHLYGSEKKGIEESEFFALFNNFGLNTMSEFKNNYIYGTTELPLAEWLGYFGVDLIFLPDEQTIDDKTKAPAYWGLKWRFDDHYRAIINYVDKEGPAMSAGISPFDEIIAVNNIRLDPNNMADLISSFKPEQNIKLLIARKKVLHSYQITLKTLPLSNCKIMLKREPNAAQKAARISWLGQ